MHLRSRLFAICFLFVCGSARLTLAQETLNPSLAKKDSNRRILWYDIRNLELEGKGWSDTKSFFDRFPARAAGVVRDAVWRLSKDSTGICVRFETNANAISARWTLTRRRLAIPHMPATGVSGLDLYVQLDNGQWRWLSVGQPKRTSNITQLVDNLPAGRRQYLLYLPLYNGVKSVEIGIPAEASLMKAKPRAPGREKPVVFYGTSITQGASASRPGMVHTAILGRRLNRPIINLGFAGDGRMEPEVARFMAELDPAVYVIDCLPNLDGDLTAERTEPLVRILRKARPNTPILLVEDRTYANSFLLSDRRTRNEESRAALRAAYERLKTAGDENLYYLEGETLLGADGDDTVDGSHPTDLGFFRQANAFENVLRPILEDSERAAGP